MTKPRKTDKIKKGGLFFLAGSLLFWLCSSAWAETYQVGPGKQYSSLGSVVGQLSPGDIVEVDGDESYSSGISISRDGNASNRITIKGIPVNGNLPVISGGSQFGFEVLGDYITIQGFEVTGASKAGIGIYSDEVIIRNCIIRDCPRDGIMGYGSGTGNVTVEYTEIYGCGRNGSPAAHQIYMATDESSHPGSVFRVQHCYLHDGSGGNNIKSRSERNEIYYSWVGTSALHSMELIGIDPADNRSTSQGTAREDSDIVGCVVQVGSSMACARIGGDGTGDTNGRYRFVNNSFVLPGRGDVIRMYDGSQTLEMHNNVIYNLSGASNTNILSDGNANWANGRQVMGSNNWVQSGSRNIPSEWEGTIIGDDPGFVNEDNGDFTLESNSPLVNAGNSDPGTFSSYPFPNPLWPVQYVPPTSFEVNALPLGRSNASGNTDIGAYEYGYAVSVDYRAPGNNDKLKAGTYHLYDILGRVIGKKVDGKVSKAKGRRVLFPGMK
ncbi:right-handed parallel beta-helix repeat-containing protein [Fibrobacterota bacterium]